MTDPGGGALSDSVARAVDASRNAPPHVMADTESQLPPPVPAPENVLHTQIMANLHGLTRACMELGRGYERLAATCCMSQCTGPRPRDELATNTEVSPEKGHAPSDDDDHARAPLAPLSDNFATAE